MADGIALAVARDDVLRKVGRNVVNFAHMEAMLKVLNAEQQLSGAISDLPEIAAKAKTVAAKRPMGRLAEEFVRVVYSSTEPTVEHSPSEASLGFSFRIEADPAFLAERKKALRAVVGERNRLIHKWLASFEPDSLESCKALGVALDAQNETVRPEIEVLEKILLALRQHKRVLSQYLVSDAFSAELRKGGGGA